MNFPGIELVLFNLGLSVLLGGLIGLEREIHEKAAGFRTHALICIGATMFTLLSMSFPGPDPQRIAAGIVTGIGFLGGGVIFKSENNVLGLTSAATIWVTAAIGLAIGLGFYLGAVATTAFILLTLFVGRRIKRLIAKIELKK